MTEQTVLQFETREAIASIMVAMAGGNLEPNVREALVTLTDIPPHLIPQAAEEMQMLLPDLFAMVMLASITGNKITTVTALEMIQSAPWRADGDAKVTTNTTLRDPDTGDEVNISSTRNLKGK